VAYAPGPDAISITGPEVNFDWLEGNATTIGETQTRLATRGNRQHSSAAGTFEDDDELPPGFFSIYMVKMPCVLRQPVDAMRLRNTPEQTLDDVEGF
jgi:hypothetical protein